MRQTVVLLTSLTGLHSQHITIVQADQQHQLEMVIQVDGIHITQHPLSGSQTNAQKILILVNGVLQLMLTTSVRSKMYMLITL